MSEVTAAKRPRVEKTIFLVDDHALVRRGLRALIESEPGLAVVGEAATAAEALVAIEDHAPDLVIVDLELEELDGLDLIKSLKSSHPNVHTLVVSMHDEGVYAERALRAGAGGYVSKRQLDNSVLVAIHRVLTGETYMSRTLEARLAVKYVRGQAMETDSPMDVLSDRELQVFRLIGRGRPNREIAETLHLSVKTVESHREHIKQKLQLQSATELAHRATQWVAIGRFEPSGPTRLND